MRLKLFILIAACSQLSCGGVEGDVDLLEPEVPVVDSTQISTWPDAPDLGVVVFSEVVPLSDPPPPPELAR